MQPGIYVNFMSGDEEDRVKEAYNERWDCLVAVKSHYDHRNFFRLNQNIPPIQTAPAKAQKGKRSIARTLGNVPQDS